MLLFCWIKTYLEIVEVEENFLILLIEPFVEEERAHAVAESVELCAKRMRARDEVEERVYQRRVDTFLLLQVHFHVQR